MHHHTERCRCVIGVGKLPLLKFRQVEHFSDKLESNLFSTNRNSEVFLEGNIVIVGREPCELIPFDEVLVVIA